MGPIIALARRDAAPFNEVGAALVESYNARFDHDMEAKPWT
jgi:hypothetical protein